MLAHFSNGGPGILQVILDPDHLREAPAQAKLLNFHACVGYARKEPAAFRKYLTGSSTQITADDERSNSVQHCRSRKLRLPASRAVNAHLHIAIGWHSVRPREEAIRVCLPFRPESISASRVHVEVGKAGSLYPSG